MSSAARSRMLSLLVSSACVAAATLVAPLRAGAAPLPLPRAQLEKDLGATPAAEPVTASLVLKVRNAALLEAFVALTQEPGPAYHKFLSVQQFTDLFAPSSSDISTITRYLRGFGITVSEVYADRLVIHATGTVDAFNKAFDVDLHEFTARGSRFRRPRRAPRVPVLLRDLLVSVGGFSTEAQYRPQSRRASALAATGLVTPPVVLPPEGAIATGVPGNYTVGDFANFYNVNPLYDAAIDGTGTTIGIVTLADFIPQDAYDYWTLIGLDVDQDRITQVHVDGGGVLSGPAGSGETSLDVEQAGGIAPGAKLIVYDAPNTDAGFLDLFYKAASDNLVDTLSVSWGSSELLYFTEIVGVDRRPELQAFHQAFLELAAQGISTFAAAGDNGAFDFNDAFNDPVDNVLTVLSPASDPAITAAGGTTLPVTLSAGPGTPKLVVSTEQAWGWDYIENYLVAVFGDAFEHAEFPGGAGGGVSSLWGVPWYQRGTPGIRTTEPDQRVVLEDPVAGPIDFLDLPAQFAGRNLPDVSANADPFSGYLVNSTTDGGLGGGSGGTSFVAPQFNGVTALVAQAVGGRIGLWNPMLYRFKRTLGARATPFVDITAGDNWFYAGAPGYDLGSGLGVLDVTRFALAVARESKHHGRD